MAKIGLYYGSTTGNTEYAADGIVQAFDAFQPGLVEKHDITDNGLEGLTDYKLLILGIPTWDIGELQYDWIDAIGDLVELDLGGKTVAIFGLGDQNSYPDTFQDAMGMLADAVRNAGAKLVGFTEIDDYDFETSLALNNGMFTGLALDEINQPELTDERIKNWVIQLKAEFVI